MRPPFTYNDLVDAFKGNPHGLLVTSFYFSFETRTDGIERVCQDIQELTLEGEHGAVSALVDIHRALMKTTDNEYNWIRNRLGFAKIYMKKKDIE